MATTTSSNSSSVSMTLARSLSLVSLIPHGDAKFKIQKKFICDFKRETSFFKIDMAAFMMISL